MELQAVTISLTEFSSYLFGQVLVQALRTPMTQLSAPPWHWLACDTQCYSDDAHNTRAKRVRTQSDTVEDSCEHMSHTHTHGNLCTCAHC